MDVTVLIESVVVQIHILIDCLCYSFQELSGILKPESIQYTFCFNLSGSLKLPTYTGKNCMDLRRNPWRVFCYCKCFLQMIKMNLNIMTLTKIDDPTLENRMQNSFI